MSNKTITIKLTRSVIGCTDKQKATIRGLGLSRINPPKTRENTPAVRGMIKAMIQWIEIVK